MGRTLVEIMPLALAAALSPTGFLIVIKIMSGSQNPERRTLAFLSGAALFLAGLGVLVQFVFKSAAAQSGSPSSLSAAIDVILGVLILLILARSSWVQGRPRKPKKEKQRKQPYLLFGALYMLTNSSSLIPFIAAGKRIAASGQGLMAELLLWAVLLITTMSLISLPLAITYLAPDQAARIMGPVKLFMTRYGTRVARIFFLIIALYLIVHGARSLV